MDSNTEQAGNVTYLRNAWYVAAWSLEVKPGELLARTILDEPVVFFRDEHGKVAALLDRCPHRFAPLSMGTVEGGVLTCGYHGLAFSGTGACVGNPHGPVVRGLNNRAFAVCEAYDAIWIWGGDPMAADQALIPALSFADRSGADTGAKAYLRVDAQYELVADNIMDVTHIDYVHKEAHGTGAVSRTKPKVIVGEDNTVTISWISSNEILSRTMREFLPGKPDVERADLWIEITWHAPMVLDKRNGATFVGRPREEGGESRALQTMTPETSTSTHYFLARRAANGPSAVDERNQFADIEHSIINLEDRPMLESQQSRIGDSEFWSLKPALLPSDVGAVQARRMLQKMIANEARNQRGVAGARRKRQ